MDKEEELISGIGSVMSLGTKTDKSSGRSIKCSSRIVESIWIEGSSMRVEW